MHDDRLKQFLIENFTKYTQIDTTSIEISGKVPTTDCQFDLAKHLSNQLRELGYSHIKEHPNAIVQGILPANNPNLPTLAFVAHLDTVSAGTSTKTKIQIHQQYDGKDIVLNKELEIVLSPTMFPELKNYTGDTILTTDGTSMLGADNKSAIAEMLAGLEMVKSTNIEHGDIHIIFLPDEEVGLLGAKELDVASLKANYAFTLDCCEIGEYVVENWNAGLVKIVIHGVTAHPMSAKGKMKNSLILAQAIMNGLPERERPEYTEKKEGYFWVKKLEGHTGETHIAIDIREFDGKKYQERKEFIKELVENLAKEHDMLVDLDIQDVYPNVKDILDLYPKATQIVTQSMKNLGITPKPLHMRGGFDGTILAKKGVPCVNVFCGAHNFHSIYEYMPLHSMVQAAKMVVEIVKESSKI